MAGLHRRTRRWVTVGSALAVVGTTFVGTVVSTGAAGASSDAPIVVGGQADLASATGVATGFTARIDAFNKAGGLDGRKIKFIGVLGTNYSTATSLANAQKLTQADHVTVVSPYFSVTCTKASTGVLAQADTVFVGNSVCAGWQGNHWGIPIDGSEVNPAVQSEAAFLQIIQTLEQNKSAGISKPSDIKIAIPGLSSAVGTFIVKSESAAAKAAGLQVVYEQAVMPITATNYAPFAQAVVSSGANTVYPPVSTPQALGLAAALKSAGFKGTFFDGSTYLPGKMSPSESSAMTGDYVANPYPANQDSIPAVKTAEEQLKAAGYSPNLTTGVSVGYWSATVLVGLLQATAKRVGAAKVDSTTMEATAKANWSYTSGNGTQVFPKAWTDPLGCYTMVQHEGTGFKLVLPYKCYPTKLAPTGL